MSRRPAEIDQSSFPSRVAARLRSLRLGAEMSMEELQGKLARFGREVPVPTLYAYERGKEAGGVDLPLALLPLIAKVYGFANAGEWLPQK